MPPGSGGWTWGLSAPRPICYESNTRTVSGGASWSRIPPWKRNSFSSIGSWGSTIPSGERKLANHILGQQRPDGTWGQYYGAPGDLSTTVECYFALKLAGVSPSLPLMVKAKEFIPQTGRCALNTGIHQDLAVPFRTVAMGGRTCHASRTGAHTNVDPVQHL